MIRYRADHARNAVVAVECDPVGYPHKDASGETQFHNSHFDSEGQAALKLVAEAEARIDNVASTRANARKQFEKATILLADAAERREEVRAHLEDLHAAHVDACSECLEGMDHADEPKLCTEGTLLYRAWRGPVRA